MNYILHLLVLVCIYGILAVSLDLVLGFAGMLSIAQAAFYGIGAYVSALMAINLGAPFFINLAGAMLCAGIVSAIVVVPTLHIKGEYLAIVTFSFQIIVYSVFRNWSVVTGGPMGIPAIPRPVILGVTLNTPLEFLLLAIPVLLSVVGISLWISHSPFGRVLKGIREDELLAVSLGKFTARFKTQAFTLSAMLAASAGCLYAHYITFVDPSTFTIMESIFILSLVVIGGAGSVWGPLLGAAVLVILPEVLRFLGLPSHYGGNVRQIVYGSLLIVFMLLRPQGLVGRFGFGGTHERE